MIIPLKKKYRNRVQQVRRQDHLDPPFASHTEKGEPCVRCSQGTKLYYYDKRTSKTNNSGKSQRAKQGTGPRRKAGLGCVNVSAA